MSPASFLYFEDGWGERGDRRFFRKFCFRALRGLARRCPNWQRSFALLSIHVPAQFLLFFADWKAIELPGLVGTVFEHAWIEGDFQTDLKRRFRNQPIASFKNN
jgi:hypothetical protein